MKKDGILMAPGTHNPFFAKMVEKEGFDAVYLTGHGAGFGVAGVPDIGLLTMTEMVTLARSIALAVDIPVISDADTGYGTFINVMRTVREFESAGVAAIHLEDQAWPKRCGHFEGKVLIPKSEMVQKLKAATDARRDEDFVIIARVDAIAPEGFEAAIERSNAYVEAGADVIFLEAPETIEQVEKAPSLVKAPMLFNSVYGGKSPQVSASELARLGYKIVIFAAGHLCSVLKAQQDWLRELKRAGQDRDFADRLAPLSEFFNVTSLQQAAELQRRYEEAGKA